MARFYPLIKNGMFLAILMITISNCKVSQQNHSLSFEENTPIAFPGAEGYGKYTSGGRGGKVFVVKNLNDNDWDYLHSFCDYIEGMYQNEQEDRGDEDKAYDETYKKIELLYKKFLKDKQSLAHSMWDKHKEAQKHLLKKNKQTGINLDI